MDLKRKLEDLKKDHKSKVEYQSRVIEELEKVNKEILRYEGAIAVTQALMKEMEEEKKPKEKPKKE